jgi:hypothetical protein
MAVMGNLKRRPTRLAATVLGRTDTAMMMALDVGGVLCWPGGRTTIEVEPGVCQFDCHICKCNYLATFQENKRHTIANGLEKSVKQQT